MIHSPKLTNTCHMTIFNTSSGYQNLKPDKNIVIFKNLCMLIWQVQIHQTATWSTLTSDMFQAKHWNNIQNLLNIFGIADNVLIVGCDANGIDHDRTLRKVMQVFHWENLKLNKNKCNMRCTKTPYFGEMISISREGVQLDLKNCKH